MVKDAIWKREKYHWTIRKETKRRREEEGGEEGKDGMEGMS